MQSRCPHLQTASSALQQRVKSPWTGSMYPDCVALPRSVNWLAICAMALAVSACSTSQPAHLPASGVSGPNGGAEETIHYDEAGHPHFF